MLQDDLADDAAARLSLGEGEGNGSINIATARLARELKYEVGGRGAKDITEEFTVASDELQSEQLVKDEFFTLFEAVGALEIMDPKMDSGFVPPGDKGIEFDVCAGMSPNQAIWIMDQMICLEMAWHDGYPLSQTLFTSLHIDRLLAPSNRYPYSFSDTPQDWQGTVDPEQHVTHTVLRAYCIATVKCCERVLDKIQSQNFYDEEDFVTHLFGRDLLPRVTLDGANNLIDEAFDWVKGSTLDSQAKAALVSRLLFRRQTFYALDGAVEGWKEAPTTLKDIEESHRFALSADVVNAFSDKVQRQLATSTPPRPMLKLDWKTACSKWIKFCEDLAAIPVLVGFWERQSPHCLKRATWAFSDRAPSTYARAVFQGVLLDGGTVVGEVQHVDLFLTDIRDLVLAGSPVADPESFQVELPSDSRHRCSRIMECFMDKAFDEYLNLYRMVCQNRCRIRRTFTQAIPLLDGLEQEAEIADEDLLKVIPELPLRNHNGEYMKLFPLKSWTRYYKLQTMEWSVLLGFETDIYLPDELGQMYWYLGNIAGERYVLLEHIELFLKERMKQQTLSGNSKYVAETLASQDWLESLKATADYTATLAGALWRLYALLVALRAIEPPLRQYAQMKLWYDARMKPYVCIGDPKPPSAVDFSKARRIDEPVTKVFEVIEEDLRTTKANLGALKKMSAQHAKYMGTDQEWKSDIKRLETTAVAASVQLAQLKGVCAKHDIKQSAGKKNLKGLVDVTIPAPDKRYHGWWVVPQLR